MRRLLRRWRFARDERGAVLVEFGLVLPVFLIMFCALLDFGFAVFTLNSMAAAVREGGRFAAILTDPVANDPRVQTRTAAVFNRLAFQDSIRAADVTVTITSDGAGEILQVAIPSNAYSYRPFTPFAPLFGLGAIPMGRAATFKSEWAPES
jgi:Flp pilus assembly protein TadG